MENVRVNVQAGYQSDFNGIASKSAAANAQLTSKFDSAINLTIKGGVSAGDSSNINSYEDQCHESDLGLTCDSLTVGTLFSYNVQGGVEIMSSKDSNFRFRVTAGYEKKFLDGEYVSVTQLDQPIYDADKGQVISAIGNFGSLTITESSLIGELGARGLIKNSPIYIDGHLNLRLLSFSNQADEPNLPLKGAGAGLGIEF